MSKRSKRFVVLMMLMAFSGCNFSVEELFMPYPHIDINADEHVGDDGSRQLTFRSEELRGEKDAPNQVISAFQPLFKAHSVLIQIDNIILGTLDKLVGEEVEVETTPYRTHGGVI